MALSLFAGTDWVALGWAAGLSALTGWSNMRINVREHQEIGEPAPSLADVLADIVIGTTAGIILALIVPEQFPKLHTLGGVTALACIGGVGGRRVYDLGLSVLEYVVRLRIGIGSTSAATKRPEGDDHV